jgi:hypothetical protein
MTLYHHSISVYHTTVETNEDMAVGKARSAAAEDPVTGLVSDFPGGRSVKNQMAIDEAKGGRFRP